jgi:hypothetical protein
MDISANGSRARFDRDVGNVTMDLNGIETLNVNALAGADTITINDLTATDVKAANIDLGSPAGSGLGDGAADTVIQDGTDGPDHVHVTRSGSQVLTTGLATRTSIVGSEAANDTLQVDTLGGEDSVAVAPDVSGLIAPLVDPSQHPERVQVGPLDLVYSREQGVEVVGDCQVPAGSRQPAVAPPERAAKLPLTAAIDELTENSGQLTGTILGSERAAADQDTRRHRHPLTEMALCSDRRAA